MCQAGCTARVRVAGCPFCSSNPVVHAFEGCSDRSADLARHEPVHGYLFTIKSFAHEDVTPLKRFLVQQLNGAFRRAEITEDDKLRIANRTFTLLDHLQEQGVLSAKAYIHDAIGRRYVGLIDEGFSSPFKMDLGKKFRVAVDGVVEQVDFWAKVERGEI